MSARCLFTAIEGSRTRTIGIEARSLIIAGWTGRDAAAVEHHIAELEAIGVRRPASVPVFYRVAADNLCTAERVQVVGRESTGEVEFVLIRAQNALWVGLGSDHTDRGLERHSVALSKQVCAKPVAASVWRFEDVAEHWDELVLRSHAHIRGERRLYQEGAVSAIRRPADLIGAYCDDAGSSSDVLPEDTVMFCGTLAVRGGLEFADRFELELHDPRLGRSLQHAYDIEALPVAD